jgi:hypothetical protein
MQKLKQEAVLNYEKIRYSFKQKNITILRSPKLTDLEADFAISQFQAAFENLHPASDFQLANRFLLEPEFDLNRKTIHIKSRATKKEIETFLINCLEEIKETNQLTRKYKLQKQKIKNNKVLHDAIKECLAYLEKNNKKVSFNIHDFSEIYRLLNALVLSFKTLALIDTFPGINNIKLVFQTHNKKPIYFSEQTKQLEIALTASVKDIEQFLINELKT